ncbi:MAG: MerR family transcriptional regulator, partial [bacterium]
PSRSASGYREYTDADVALFKRLKALVDAGYSISEAVDLAKREPEPSAPSVRPDPRVEAVGDAPPALREVPPRGGGGDIVDQMLRALLAFDRASADRLVPRLGQVSFATAIDELYVPVLHRLGDMWEQGEVTIAQEHFASGFCREQLLAMYHGVGGGPEGGLTVACATPPGERHELGLLV